MKGVRPAGDAGIMLEVDSVTEAHQVRAALESARRGGHLPGVLETVAGSRTVLALLDPTVADPTMVTEVAERAAGGEPPGEPRTVEIPVVYDGPDLDWVASHTGLRRSDIIERHARAVYTVDFLGFSPGFGYLSGLDPALRVPRRETPRERVPAGSVAIADLLTVVYPQATPGGWRLLGRTDAAVFDQSRRPPGLFAPGDRVRFVPES